MIWFLVIKKERIRTTVPVHEVIHDAPIIHQVQLHDPMPIEAFKKQFGPLEGLTHDEIIKKVLGSGECIREGDDIDAFDLGNKVQSQFFFLFHFF